MGTVKSSPEQKANPYAQNDLRQRCIRLLDLDSSYVKGNNPLQGSLRVVSLDRNPSYEALSYTWGSDSLFPSRQIICSGATIPITKNCYDALCTLKRNFKVRSIWVDAICIKQTDNTEKSHQLPLMRDIYGKARRVFIWLGNGTEESDEALEWVLDSSRDRSPLVGVKVRDFPALLLPGETLKILKMLPQFMGNVAASCSRIYD
jgi:hypothetical protein